MSEPNYTRGFKIVFPDRYEVDGAQFPSGRCVLDDSTSGLVQAAVSLEELPLVRDYPLGQVVWADHAGEVREEWRVTGDPGGSFPLYDFTFRQPQHVDPEKAARGFVALMRDHDNWVDGPHLSHRTVTESRWSEVPGGQS